MSTTTKVHRPEGADRLLVEDGGAIDVKSGGDVVFRDGATLTLENGHEIAIGDGGDATFESGSELVMESGSALDLQAGAAAFSPTLMHVFNGSVDASEINAGEVLIPGVEGRSITVHAIRAACAGTAAGATDIRIGDTDETPVVALTIAVAAADDSVVHTLGAAPANVTYGAGLREPLTEGEGVQIYKTGDPLTGTTAVDLMILYSIS